MTAQLSPTPVFKGWADNATPLAYGLLYTYEAGTTTPQASYTDSTQSTPNTNPVNLNARGECALWLDPTKTYKFNLTDLNGNQISGFPVDNILGSLNPNSSIIPAINNTYTLGSASYSWANVYVGPNAAPIYDSISGNVGYYKQTAAEIAISITPTDYSYLECDPRRYGADPTGATVSTTAVQDAFNVAQQGNSTVIIGPNCSFLCGALSLTFSGTQANSSFRISGSGTNGSRLTLSGTPAGAFITLQGSTPTSAPNAIPIMIENLSIVGPGGGPVTNGLLIQGLGYWRVSNCYIAGFNYDVYLNSALSGELEHCLLYSGVVGIYARADAGTGSGSNAVTVRNCYFAGNTAWAMDWSQSDRLKVLGGVIEGNGNSSNSPGSTASGGIAIRAAIAGGALGSGQVTLDFDGVWFEANYGLSFYEEVPTASTFPTVALRNCNFYRDGSSSAYCINIAGASFVSVEDTFAGSGIGDTATFGSAVSNLTLKNCTFNTLTDSSLYPIYLNVQTSTLYYDWGRRTTWTATLTGCTTSPTTTVRSYQQGQEIMHDFLGLSGSLQGTSNSTSATITGMPAALSPATECGFTPPTINNSVEGVQPAFISGTTITLTVAGTAAGFTASGTKGMDLCSVRYRIT
jgi:hypothetical protein